MDYFIYALIILALIAAAFYIRKIDIRTKNKHKKDAYRLLETSAPSPKEIKDTIKALRLYSGHIIRDKEAVQLINSLLDKHGHLLE
jgi:hypothetical protein